MNKIKNPSIAVILMLSLFFSACSSRQPTTTQNPEPTSTEIVEYASTLEGLTIEEFFDVSFQMMAMRSPEVILEVGLTDIYGITTIELDDISDSYQRETYQLIDLILQTLETYDRSRLTPDQEISYDIYHWYLTDLSEGQSFLYHNYLSTYMLSTSIPEQIIMFFSDIHPVASFEDARDYVTRLSLVGKKIDQLIENLILQDAAGITMPDFAVEWAFFTTFDNLLKADAEETPFYTSFEDKVNALWDVSPLEKQNVLEDAVATIEEVVLPAYQKLYSFLKEMEVYSGSDSGVWRLPDGEDYYTYRLKHYTTTDLSADEIYDLGVEHLERIHSEMREIFDTLGYPQDGTLTQLFDRVAEDSGIISGNEIIATYESLIDEAFQNLYAAFDIEPHAEVVVIPVDIGGFYIPGSVDGSRPGAFYASSAGVEEYYAMPTLAYHETIPGHHFQISLAQEMTHLPAFRQGLSFTAFAEGWALYAERLAWELGWYADDPYGNLGRLQAEAFRAARLVVDTGLHDRGWTFEQAQTFFTENTGFEVGDSVNPERQIARYLVLPGQSTSYYIGFLKMLSLRQYAMDQLGDQFDLIEYHRVVLQNGSMPLEILESVIQNYITGKISGS